MVNVGSFMTYLQPFEIQGTEEFGKLTKVYEGETDDYDKTGKPTGTKSKQLIASVHLDSGIEKPKILKNKEKREMANKWGIETDNWINNEIVARRLNGINGEYVYLEPVPKRKTKGAA